MANPWDDDEIVGGNPWDADEIIAPAKADFGNVRGGSNTSQRVIDTMSITQRNLAGAGRSVSEAYYGNKQALTEGLDMQVAAAARGANLVGLGGVSDFIAQHAGIPLRQSAIQQRQEAGARQQIDADLMDTWSGKAGYVAGSLAQILTPGIALRGTAAGRALLPTTIKGNALQGAVMGAMQPVAEGQSRAGNMALGGAAGAVGAAIPKAVGGAYRGVRNTVRGGGLSAAEKQAARVIQQEAADPARLLQEAPSAIPGVRRTLFEESLDPGVARLETRARTRGGLFREQDLANNAARVDAIRAFAGDEGTLAAAKQGRTDATSGLLRAALESKVPAQQNALRTSLGLPASGGVDVVPVRSTLASMMAGSRSNVRDTLGVVAREIEEQPNSVAGAYNVRKTITDLLEGKAGSDKASAKAATRELMGLRDVLDQQITKTAPEFGDYLGAYVGQSRPINQMELGQYMLQKGSGGQFDEAGRYALQPGKFGAKMKDLDSAAVAATKFQKAKAAQILDADAMATLQAVNDDLNRASQRLSAGSGAGSHTETMQALTKRMGLRAAARVIPGVGGAVEFLEAANAKHLEETLERLIANPAEYRRVVGRLPANDRKLIEQALVRLGGVTGGSVPALAE